MDLAKYMTDSIYDIMAKAYLNVLSNPRQARIIHRMQRQFSASSQRRTKLLEEDGIEVPPFLIASIATTCNLQCKGCYARKNGIAAPDNQPRRQTLAPEQWRTIFDEAADLGVNFALIAGGEPLTRRDLLEQIAQVENMIFPVFTNGTMVGASYMEFFKQHMNMIPVFSLEGDAMQTDNRRGQGVYRLVEQSMQKMKEAKLFYGASITVTTENYRAVTEIDYVRQLRDKERGGGHHPAFLPRRRKGAGRLSGCRTGILPHRPRRSRRALPLLPLLRQQCAADRPSRCLAVASLPPHTRCPCLGMGAYRRLHALRAQRRGRGHAAEK